jgi:hypothetical protein
MTILIVLLFIVVNIIVIVGIYFMFLRKLSPTSGYISLAIIIALLAVVDVFAFDYANKGIRKTMADDITPEQCTKEYVQKMFNQLAKVDNIVDKEILSEQLLQCFEDKKQVILVRHSITTSHTVISGQPSKIALDNYLKSLIVLNLGDSIAVDLVENNSTGLIMYLEISEKQSHK